MIGPFNGKYRFLSNFWPVTLTWRGIEYPSVEHAYQASKTKDKTKQRSIATLTAGQAKRYGAQDLPLPEKERLYVMGALLRKKFLVPELQKLLLETGEEELVEVNFWNDTFWGKCRGVGQNHLGQLLMLIRKEARDGRLYPPME